MYEFKLEYKTAEETCNINKAIGQGTVNKRTMQLWFKNFRIGNESLEGGGRSSTVDNDELRRLMKASPRTTVRKCAGGLSQLFWII